MFFFPGTDKHVGSPVTRHLQANMTCGPKAINAEICSPLNAGPALNRGNAQASKADDAGAQKRRSLQIGEAIWDGINKILVGQRVLGKAAIHGIAGKGGIVTKIFSAALAVKAQPAGLV